MSCAHRSLLEAGQRTRARILSCLRHIGDDVRDSFLQHDAESAAAFSPYPARSGTWLADLLMLASMRLSAMGLTDHFGGGICTLSNPDRVFSHRRDKTPGRMAALIWLAR